MKHFRDLASTSLIFRVLSHERPFCQYNFIHRSIRIEQWSYLMSLENLQQANQSHHLSKDFKRKKDRSLLLVGQDLIFHQLLESYQITLLPQKSQNCLHRCYPEHYNYLNRLNQLPYNLKT